LRNLDSMALQREETAAIVNYVTDDYGAHAL
jgi:hypothetical protein